MVLRKPFDAVMQELLVRDISVVSRPLIDVRVYELLPAERPLVQRMSAEREREFTLGRNCIRLALTQMGYAPSAILVGRYREPIWPPGVVGSLTHDDQICCAAVARAGEYLSIGIDVERDRPLVDGALPLIADEIEQAMMRSLPGDANWSTLLFSIKESIYKALFAVVRCWINFLDVRVEIDARDKTFTAEVKKPFLALSQKHRVISGRFGGWDNHILSAVVLRNDSL